MGLEYLTASAGKWARRSITDASGTLSQKWLESAFLQKQAGIWKIVFLHSTRAPAVPPESHGK
jgi:hypothetical protein